MEVGWINVTTLGILTENPTEVPTFLNSELLWRDWRDGMIDMIAFVDNQYSLRIWDF